MLVCVTVDETLELPAEIEEAEGPLSEPFDVLVLELVDVLEVGVDEDDDELRGLELPDVEVG